MDKVLSKVVDGLFCIACLALVCEYAKMTQSKTRKNPVDRWWCVSVPDAEIEVFENGKVLEKC